MPEGGVDINPNPEEETNEEVSLQEGELVENPEASTSEEEVEEADESTEEESEAADEESEEDESEEDNLPFSTDEMAAFTKEVDESGGLSEDSYTAIQERMNVSREMIDQYIAGQKALQQESANEYVEMAGGAEKWQEIRQWAEEGVPPVQLQTYTKMIESGDAGQIQTAITSLRAQYENSKRDLSAPKPQTGRSSRKADVYATEAEWLADMSNSKYTTDPSFRSKVEKKFARSFG